MRKIKFLTYVLVVLLLWGQRINVCAGDATPIIIDGEVYTWTETMNLQVEKVSDREVHVYGEVIEADELYNYAVLSSMFEGAYKKDVYDSDYAAITLEVENGKDAPVFLNVSFADKNNNQLVMKENAYILKEVNGEIFSEKINVSSFIIEEGFKGIVTIPLSMFEDSEKNSKEFVYANLTSWSVGVLLEGKTTADLYIKNLAWQDQDYIEKYENSLGTCIDGSETVQIPEHGESIEFYQMNSDKDHTYKFLNDGLTKGISIEENGKLVLDSTVEEQIITIKAIDELGTTICKEVALVNSWRKSNEKGFFYGPEELEKIEYAFDGITQSHITVVRWVLCVGCVIVFFTYVVFYAKYLQDKKREEE